MEEIIYLSNYLDEAIELSIINLTKIVAMLRVLPLRIFGMSSGTFVLPEDHTGISFLNISV